MSLLFPADYAHGFPRIVQIANPGAGVLPSIAVPGGQIWRVHSLHGVLTTSAVAGVRIPELVIVNPTPLRIASITAPAGIGPVVAFNFCWALAAAPSIGAVANIHTTMPDLLLTGGCAVLIGWTALDPGDAWTDLIISYEEWIG